MVDDPKVWLAFIASYTLSHQLLQQEPLLVKMASNEYL